MPSDIAAWLAAHDLEKYAPAFEENDLDLDIVGDLDDGDLKDLGVASMGHRKRLLRAIAALSDEPAPPAPAAAEAPAPEPMPPAAPDIARSQVERRQLSVMFVDLVGSTALAARLDPEAFRAAIRTYQDVCAKYVSRYEGFVAKYMGDGVLAYFGWPIGHEDDAERAVNAAIAIVQEVAALQTPDGGTLAVRVGIASGPVLVGDIIGEGPAQEAAVTGETPNLAARLQETAGANSVVIDAATRLLVQGLFEEEALPARTLKGIEGEVTAWRIVRAREVESRFEAARGSALTRLVGREHELAMLRDRWELARLGEGQVTLLSGEAGIGKSRLTQALMSEIESAEHFRIRFQCSPYHVTSALHPFIRQLERAAHFEAEDENDARLDKLENLMRVAGEETPQNFALLANLLSLDYAQRYGPIDLNPQQTKRRTLEVLIAQLFGLAGSRPVLFLLEDAHWIDPTSLELLELTIPRATRLPVLFLITHRPEWQAPFYGLADVTSLNLNRMGRRQIGEIVSAIAEKSVPAEVVDRIVDRTDGVPLFVEEMTRALMEAGLTAAVDSNSIPATLQGSLTARLDRLSPEAKEVAQAASVIGREVSLPLLRRALGDDARSVEAPIANLLESQLMIRSGAHDDDVVLFRHALIRDAAYQSLVASRRRDFHQRIAEALRRHFPQVADTQAEIVARHYAGAGRLADAIDYWRRAGRRATENAANQEAVDHFQNALADLERLKSGRDRDRQELDIRVELGVPLIAATGYASSDVENTYMRACQLSEALGDDEMLFTSTRGLWNCVFDQGEIDRALDLSHRLLEFAERDGGDDKAALAGRALGSTRLNRGEFVDAVAAFEATLEAAEDKSLAFALQDHGEAPQIVARQYRGWALAMMGRLDEGLADCEAAVAMARELNHPITLAFSIHILSNVLLLRRDYPAAEAASAESLAISRDHGFVFWIAASKVIDGSVRAHQGVVEDGLALAMEGLREWRATGAKLHVATWSALAADAAIANGRFDLAETLIEDGLRAAETQNEGFVLAELQRQQGLLAQERGDTTAARAAFEAALATARSQRAGVYELRAALELARLHEREGGDGLASAGDVLRSVLNAFPPTKGLPELGLAAALLKRAA